MKARLRFAVLAATLAAATRASAAIHYVDVASTNASPPYSTWATAAATIQDAIDTAAAGDEILVTNGAYAAGGRVVYGATSNRVAVTKPLLVRSVNGPKFTLIQGYQPPGSSDTDGAIRCVYLAAGASLNGFTVMNGMTRTAGDEIQEQSGGGIWCESAGSVISNCVVTGNSAALLGGGVYSGTAYNCLLATNSAGFGGGVYQGALNNCVVAGNSAYEGGGSYGGVFQIALNRCLLIGNSAGENGGGACYGVLNNCVLTGNSAGSGGGEAGGLVVNCTIAGNSAYTGGGASGHLGGTESSGPTVLSNCIIYFNSSSDASVSSNNEINYDRDYTVMNYCCTAPQPTHGVGNIIADPQFADAANGNYRLNLTSPCINTGDNGCVTNATDFDGRPRITGGTVDLGAFEFQPGIDGLFIGWLQKYGLPTDGSADFADTDGDGMNNWREWVTGTDPTNSQSLLRLLPPAREGANVVVTWQSVAGIAYSVERGTALSSSAFTWLAATNAVQNGTTSYVDTTATGSGPFFYRVSVFYPHQGP